MKYNSDVVKISHMFGNITNHEINWIAANLIIMCCVILIHI